jgi:hypothetical protein
VERRRDEGDILVSCRHHVGGECTNGLVLPVVGPHPSAGVCRHCDHYDGPARGLGDVVAMATAVTGIDRAVKAVVGRNCGCAARRAALNQAIPLK